MRLLPRYCALDLFQSDPSFERIDSDRATISVAGLVVGLQLDPLGWLRASAPLPVPSPPGRNTDFQLIGIQPSLEFPAKFTKSLNATTSWYSVAIDVPLAERHRREVFDTLAADLKLWLGDAIRAVRHPNKCTPGQVDENVASSVAVERRELLEAQLTETGAEWSRDDKTGVFYITADDEYLQKTEIQVSPSGNVLFRSPLFRARKVNQDCLRAVSDFLIRANDVIRLARASIVVPPARVSAIEEMITLILEVHVPERSLSVFTVRNIVASLTAAARYTRLEAEVLCEPEAAHIYFQTLERSRQNANHPTIHQHAHGS